jgi:hypothetical protein
MLLTVAGNGCPPMSLKMESIVDSASAPNYCIREMNEASPVPACSPHYMYTTLELESKSPARAIMSM